jgi:electron transfer flavoprotein-quinone oxidoreductase
MLEKGKVPGERNVSGGVLYGSYAPRYGLRDLVPGFETQAPLERKVVSHEVYVLSAPSREKGEYRSYRFSGESIAARLGLFNLDFETGFDYTILRKRFDPWLADKAIESGATLSTGTAARALLIEQGKTVGVETHHEELRANVVVDCSGVTSQFPEQAGLRQALVPRKLYHGVKQVFRINTETIEKRLRLRTGEGKALAFLGSFMEGIQGGAFLYPNRDTISLGIVASMDSLIQVAIEQFDRAGKLVDVLDGFASHPMIASLLDGAEMVEYSAHNVPKGFRCILKKPFGDGFLVAGDSLGAFVKIGPMVDGIRPAIASGIMAAETCIEASSSGSYTAQNLSRYKDKLIPVYDDVSRSGRDSFLSESSLVYKGVPWMLFLTRAFTKREKVITSREGNSRKDSTQRMLELKQLLKFDQGNHSGVTVDSRLADGSGTKPWIPLCPMNCFTLVTGKGVFASYRDLYEHNLTALGASSKVVGKKLKRGSYLQTLKDIAEGSLAFDHQNCVGCATCAQIGPKAIVAFEAEKDGKGVSYQFG